MDRCLCADCQPSLHPDQIDLDAVVMAPRARDVFGERELRKRIAAHRERIRKNLWILEKSNGPKPVRCWACGCKSPKGTHSKSCGWKSRPFVYSGSSRESGVEIYCRECFAEWGWGDSSERQTESAA